MSCLYEVPVKRVHLDRSVSATLAVALARETKSKRAVVLSSKFCVLRLAPLLAAMTFEETEFDAQRPDVSKNLMNDYDKKMLALAPRGPIPVRPLDRDPARRPMLLRTGQYERQKPEGLKNGKARPPGDQRTQRLTQVVARLPEGRCRATIFEALDRRDFEAHRAVQRRRSTQSG